LSAWAAGLGASLSGRSGAGPPVSLLYLNPPSTLCKTDFLPILPTNALINKSHDKRTIFLFFSTLSIIQLQKKEIVDVEVSNKK
jgi:hypothetical protein